MSFGRTTKAQLFAMPDKARQRVYQQQFINAAIAHAKWAALKYSSDIIGMAREGKYDRTTGKFHAPIPGCNTIDILALAGGHDGIMRTMESYLVKPPLREYATRITIALIKAGRP